MRIIAGSRKGHRIAAPKGRDTRPTSDRVREAAFMLMGPVDGTRVLDLFAGSGAMGLEALSRGAEQATFVEADPRAAAIIQQNLEKLRLTGARIVRADALRALAAEASAGAKYDLVLVDPPYDDYSELEPMLANHVPAVLAEDGLVVVETSDRTQPQLPLEERTSRRYGSARITLYT
jgi:16S rRNA (guanine966-N2)-methyltransferase